MRLSQPITRQSLLLGLTLALSLVWITGRPGRAQSQALLKVNTNTSQGVVYLDSLRLGPAKDSPWHVPADTYRVTVMPRSEHSWSQPRPSRQVVAAPGDSLSLRLNFPYAYLIHTVPSEATVWLRTGRRQRRLGKTPLTYWQTTPVQGTFVVNKAEFDSVHVTPGREIWNMHKVQLVGPHRPFVERHSQLPGKNQKGWLTYLAAGVAVVSGGAAVYFRHRANQLKRSGLPVKRAKGRRYRRLSMGALVTMQAGIGVLAVRFILDHPVND